MFTDLTPAALADYRSSVQAPEDLDAFWAGTLATSREAGWAPVVVAQDTGLSTIETYDVTFAGFGGEPIRAWLRRPAGVDGPLPAVVEYVGYGGGRGHVLDNLLWASAGFAHFLMDTRGQGSGWSTGDTPDSGPAGPQVPGVMTRGILDPATYYYRRLFTDAARAVDTVRALDGVDASRVAVRGGSQGGGMALAVSALVPEVRAVVAHVPFLCDIPRGATITDAYPYREIADYLATHRHQADQVLRTLAYIDGVNLGARATAPALITAALMDPIVPPSTVYAAFHAYGGPKQLRTWTYNAHEGGGTDDAAEALEFLRQHLG
jgi:cephalosporin-C deacetylase